jgi:hypothetical protein
LKMVFSTAPTTPLLLCGRTECRADAPSLNNATVEV